MVNAYNLLGHEEATDRSELIPILEGDVCCQRDDDADQAIEMEINKDGCPTDLEAHLTLTSTVLFAVGQIIGSGIFVSPNEVIRQTGSPGMALVMWVAGGLISLCGALSFSELGTLIHRSGGEFQYIKAAYGDLPAFVYMWVCGVIRNSMGCAVIALTFSSYLIGVFVAPSHPYFALSKKAVAGGGIMLIIALNAYSTRCGVRLANLFCVLKLVALSVLVMLGAWKLAEGGTENISKGFEGTTMHPGRWTTALFAALWSYSGWNSINMMSGEIKNAGKNIPRALVISQITLITVYLLVNIAYCTILSVYELEHQDAIALYVGRKMLLRFGEGWARVGEIFFSVSVAIASYGSLNSSLMTSCRLPFIAAQENMFPKCIALIQCSTGTPIISLLYIGCTSFICVWPSNITNLIAYVGFLSWAWWGLCFLAVPVLRYKLPNHPRQFKVFLGIPILAVISSLYLVIGPFFVTPLPCVAWVGVCLIGVPIYYGYVDTKNTCSRWMGWLLHRLAQVFRAQL